MEISCKGKGGIVATIVADSVSAHGIRITTLQLCYPRFIHSEFMTHRVFSRNASSSRAIPIKKMLKQVRENPATPIHWGTNQAGMQAGEELSIFQQDEGKEMWVESAKSACDRAEVLMDLGLHKQIVNRILEPFQFIHTVVTATEWDNFFALRNHEDAQPEIQELARCMHTCMLASKPELLKSEQWHLPYVNDHEFINGFDTDQQSIDVAIKCSVARCARVSYLNHDQTEPSVENDISLYNMLAVRPYSDDKGNMFGEDDPVHLSPLEHQATPTNQLSTDVPKWSANFKGWMQYRQLI